MEQRLSAYDISFDPAPKREEESYSPALYLSASHADPAHEVEREEWDDDVIERLARALEKLHARSRSILKGRSHRALDSTGASRHKDSAERLAHKQP